jgi:hypothetical protein
MSKKTNTLEYFEKKINNLNNINKWEDKIVEIEKIKEEILIENNNILKLLISLDTEQPIETEYDIDSIITNFDKFDISKKIKYYQYFNSFIKNKENELFLK